MPITSNVTCQYRNIDCHMSDNITKIQEIRILLTLLRYSGTNGVVDFKTSNFAQELSEIVWNGNWIDSYFYNLNEIGVIGYEEIGEDGFAPIIMCSVSEATYYYLDGLVSEVEEECRSLNQRIADILSFNPSTLSKNISETQSKLDEVRQHIESNELLKPMAKPLQEIRHHFESISAVSANYEEVYKNIVRPVQQAGESGIKTTVKWAIISILVSTLISQVISNWEELRLIVFGA